MTSNQKFEEYYSQLAAKVEIGYRYTTKERCSDAWDTGRQLLIDEQGDLNKMTKEQYASSEKFWKWYNMFPTGIVSLTLRDAWEAGRQSTSTKNTEEEVLNYEPSSLLERLKDQHAQVKTWIVSSSYVYRPLLAVLEDTIKRLEYYQNVERKYDPGYTTEDGTGPSMGCR